MDLGVAEGRAVRGQIQPTGSLNKPPESNATGSSANASRANSPSKRCIQPTERSGFSETNYTNTRNQLEQLH